MTLFPIPNSVILCDIYCNTKTEVHFSPDSMYNAETKWSKEVRHFCKNAPMLLVGNKIDLRSDENTISGWQHVVKYSRNRI